MKPYDPRWRWTCPHCGGGIMTLPSARSHLRRKHYDCWSCKLEIYLVEALMEGKGYVIPVGTQRADWLARGEAR